MENNAFEKTQSFASAFFGLIDPTRRIMNYACAGHEPVFVVHPDGTAVQLRPTAPLIGVFDDQHHLFKQSFVELRPGTLFVAATDGITEARNTKGELFGLERLMTVVADTHMLAENEILQKVLEETDTFCIGRPIDDDLAIVVSRFM